MKIHNYGNDYAYQQKQKSAKHEEAKMMVDTSANEEMAVQEQKEVTNVGNQVQDGGEKQFDESCTQTEEVHEGMEREKEIHQSEETENSDHSKKKKKQ